MKKIFKRIKQEPTIPKPNFDDNWRHEQYEKNLKSGVDGLQKVGEVMIFKDSNGIERTTLIELVDEIKRITEWED